MEDKWVINSLGGALSESGAEPTSLYSGLRVFFFVCVLFLAFFPISGFRHLQQYHKTTLDKLCAPEVGWFVSRK